MNRQERDYSGRSLFEKLGILARHHVALVGRHDEGFTTLSTSGWQKARRRHCARSTT